MIIIDEAADSRLVRTLESARHEAAADAARCLHFKFSSQQVTGGDLRQQVVQSAQVHMGAANPEVYCCDDGDIYIVSHEVASKQAHMVMLDIAEHLHVPVSDTWVNFCDLQVNGNELLLKLSQKLEAQLDKKRALAAQMAKAQQQHQAEERREHILNQQHVVSHAQIQQRRLGRSVPELMLIEDDPFSRRLVENVLNKEYPLKALADAEHAIFSYVATAPDLLFLDINLPDVNGLELLAKIMGIDPKAHVVMLSGNADQHNITQAMKLGAKGFIAKPFTREKLMQYIHRCPTAHH